MTQHLSHPSHSSLPADPKPGFLTRVRHARRFFAKHRLATVITAAILVLIVLPVLWLARPKPPQYVTAAVTRGDLQQTVEAVGTVTSEHDLELKFPLGGIVDAVNVQEGDAVNAGDILVRLRSGSPGAAVAMQAANLQSALADLRKLQEGMRPEDLAVAEAQVANRQASLQVAQAALESATQTLQQAKDQLKALQQEADTTLGGQVATSRTTIASQLVAGETALSSIDDILAKTIVQDAIIKASPGADQDIRDARRVAAAAITDVRRQSATAQDYHDALQALQAAQNALGSAANACDQLFALLSNLQETSYFTASVREGYKTTISTQRSLVQSALSAVTSAYSGLQSASATYDTRIAAAQATISSSDGARQKAQADILTYQTALQAQQADLASKKAGARQADLDAAQARVRQAQAALAQADANYNDTILRSPVDGTVSHVNVKVGEATPVTGPAVTVLGRSPFRVEMYVSEVDVPKLLLTQSGTVDLDAFPDVHYRVRVSEIDTAPTLVDGVSKYRVKLDFVYPHPELKIGMTGDATIVTGERKNILRVPLRSVLSHADGKKYVRLLTAQRVTEQAVITGMEGQSGDVEVLTGLSGGETVVVLQK